MTRPTPLHAAFCPYVAPSPDEGCSAAPACSSDEECRPEGQMCCSNACGGRSCMTPNLVPYYQVPLECPTNRMLDLVGTCNISQRSCTEDSACAANMLCCQTGGCGHYCTRPVSSAQPCYAVRELLRSGSSVGGTPGQFIPTCQNDGSFSPTQVHGSTGLSWCVNVQTGQPVSPFNPRGSTSTCSSELYSSFRR